MDTPLFSIAPHGQKKRWTVLLGARPVGGPLTDQEAKAILWWLVNLSEDDRGLLHSAFRDPNEVRVAFTA